MAQQTEDVCLEHKVVLIGDHMVGKTSLFTRFKTGRFVQVPSQTRKEAEHMKKWTQNGEELCVSRSAQTLAPPTRTKGVGE